ncbi:MAG: sugar ABC transporter ATP-binding protein [Rhodobacteraceae bacterium]|nr:sugar ABC transporter ATP-binding protein [Paracoccaceae bacterium]
MKTVLELRNVTKEFPGVRALDSVNLHVGRNEVVGLIGENGAGKSTLVKILAGIHRINEGEMLFEGKPTSFRSPRDAFNHGLAMVFQEQSIIQTLTVAENIFLGREQEFLRFGIIDKRSMNSAAKVELAKVHLNCEPSEKCSKLDFAARQMVEIAKALSLDGRLDSDIVILLDEPTSVLERREINLLFEIIGELKAKASIIFISHRLDEVLEVSDRIYVLRDGAVVHETASADASITGLHEHMVGRQLDHEYYRENKQRSSFGDPVLSVRDLTIDGELRNLSVDLAAGEILGLAGVVGSGREAFARCLGGLMLPSSGEILIDGKPVKLNQPNQAVDSGFGFVPSERKSEGIVSGLSVAENMTLAAGKRFSRFGFIRFDRERTECQHWIKRLQIRTPSVKTPMQSLSGGNQQKVVLSKWQIVGSKVAVLDHPTRGIDVGAKEDVYELIREMADQGIAIVLLGDTLEEVIGLSNRILVLRDGEVSAQFDAPAGAKPDQLDLISNMV